MAASTSATAVDDYFEAHLAPEDDALVSARSNGAAAGLPAHEVRRARRRRRRRPAQT